eukprot:TRINITY_DN3842_c0_g1_i9.p1 TRINITY_DN3842_c0_g1~~TRINITY_DN3842_c0_g1_i9.p1  ORF type:complete len:171 (-),score=11.00 TRINITY_DN3842_c0_g1_i9:285-797(-)
MLCSMQILDLAAPDPTAGVRRFAPTHPSLLTPRPLSPSRHRYHPLDLLLSHSLIPSASHSLTRPRAPFTLEPCTHSTLNSRHPSPHRHRHHPLTHLSHSLDVVHVRVMLMSMLSPSRHRSPSRSVTLSLPNPFSLVSLSLTHPLYLHSLDPQLSPSQPPPSPTSVNVDVV